MNTFGGSNTNYTLMIIGVYGTEYTLGDNKSVICNTTIIDSTSKKKKSQSIAYHLVRNEVTRNEWTTGSVNTHDNIKKLLREVLPMSDK